jgi:VCBS repeat-containing protein
VTVDIWGENDAATISGNSTGNVTEDMTLTATGTLTITDPDHGQSHTQTAINAASDHGLGTYSVDSDGHWSYTVNNALVQYLAAGQTTTDSFAVTSLDGTATQTVTVTITGTNDPPVIISGPQAGNVSEGDGLPAPAQSATGQVTFSDVDASDTHTLTVSAAAVYGAASVDPNGTWHYTVSDSGAVDALAVGEHLADSFTVQVDDHHGGLATQVVSIDITGTNDAAIIGGQDTGSVTEAAGNNPGTPTATGALTVSDLDAMQSAFNTLSNSPTNYGNFTLDSAGNWTYTLNNSNPMVDALNSGQQLHDQFNVSSVDGTTHQVDITINGATDSTDLGGPTGITFNLAPTSGNGLTALGAFTATGDPDVGDTFAWSVGAGSSGGFVVSGGVLNASGVAPGDATLNLVVTDQGLNTFSQTYHVWIGSSG